MRNFKRKRKLNCMLCIIMTLSIALGFIPAQASESVTNSRKPVLIYKSKDFEKQNIGEVPHGFFVGNEAIEDKTMIVEMPTDSNPNNKAVMFAGSSENAKITTHSMYHAPVYLNFVISMRFMVNDTSNEKFIHINHGNTDANKATYLYGGTYYKFLTLTNNIQIDKTVVYSGLEADTWYKMDLAFDLKKNQVTVYVNDREQKTVSMAQTVKTVDSINFNHALIDGSDWYIDDYRTYVSDVILSDDEFATDLAAYKESSLMPPERFETSRIYELNPFVFHTLYGEFVMMVDGIRYFKDTKYYTFPTPLKEEDGRIIVPLRVFAESFGAKVEWNSEGIIITYGDKKLQFIPNSDVYNLNGKPSKLYHPIRIENGVALVQIDVLTHFFGVNYKKYGKLISFSGDVECAFDWSPKLDNPTKATDFVGLPANVMHRIERSLCFVRPSSEKIAEIINEANMKGLNEDGTRSPRLLFTDWDEVRANMEKEPEYKAGVERIIMLADSYLEKEPVKYELIDGLRGEFPQQILDRGLNLSFAYKVTGDKKYKDKLWEEVEAIYNTFPDFNPRHELDPGNSAHGMAYIYDWLYNDWSEDELQKIEAIFERNIIPHFTAAYRAGTPLMSDNRGYASSLDSLGDNQVVVIHSGVVACAIAYFEKHPALFADMLSTTFPVIESTFLMFAPDGGYEEGGAYWTYLINALPVMITNLITGAGDDFGLCKAPGIMKTAYFPISIYGSTGSFKAGDDSGSARTHGFQMFAAKQSGDYALAKFYKENNRSYDIITLANYVFDSDIEADNAQFELQTDYYFDGLQQVTMRSGFDSADTVVFFHGGTNTDSHGHRDTGSFLLDMLGERWTSELVHEDYNLREYGSYVNDGSYNDPIYSGRYYRDKGESKNTVIANYDSVAGDLSSSGKAQVVKQLYTKSGAYAIMNLTSNNPVYECGLRGIKINRITGEVIVEDDYQAKEAADFWWFMTTDADIKISADKKSAILTKNNKRIWVGIISDCEETFEILESKPLSILYPDTYGYAVTPPLQTPVEEKYKRLAIHNPETERFNVSIAFSPLGEIGDVPDVFPEYQPMGTWKFDENVEKGMLENVLIDGKAFDEFEPEKFNYNVNVLTDKSEIPEITAIATDEYEVETRKTTTLPGISTVLLKKDGVVVAKYNFVFKPLNITTNFVNDRQLAVADYWATSEPQPENVASNLFDGDLATKYATDEYGGSVTLDYGKIHTIHEVMIAFTNGAMRTENFMIEYSEDGSTWKVAREKGVNSGTTTERESYAMNDVKARYIRVSFYGNNAGSAWVSVAELCAFSN